MSLSVLSLFDGVSSGQVALNRAGIKFDKYFASEICKDAIKVAQHNFPDTIQLGDIRKVESKNLPSIQLICAGSPCQSFSGMGKKEGFDGASSLFFEFLRLLKEISPKYFLLENVVMKKEWENVISEALGVKPILINSSLVCAANRPRLYWTNIPNILQPEDKNLRFKDIIDDNFQNYEFWPEHRLQKFKDKKYIRKDTYRILTPDSKVPCLTVRAGHGGSDEPKTFFNDKIRRLTPLEWERLQNLDESYTSVLESNNKRRACIGNGWTIDVIVNILKNIVQ